VAADYTLLAAQHPLAYWPRLLVVVFAEELLFRGCWLQLSSGAAAANGRANVAAFGALPAALSLVSYALVQIGWGSFAVTLAAALCGAVFLLEAHLTRSIIAPLITHAIWSSVVLLFHPVTS
jgi:membrane protease YdiL (CAAX protease family)